MLNVQSGSSLSIKETFLDDFLIPLVPIQTPTVTLYDNSQDIVFVAYATPDIIPGTWAADISIPKLDNHDALEFVLIWVFETTLGVTKSKESILIEPSVQERVSETVALFGDASFTINVPVIVSPSMVVTCSLYEENTLLYSYDSSNPFVSINTNLRTTNIVLPCSVATASMYPRTLLVQYTPIGALIPETYTFKAYVVTPSVLSTASLLENFINKSRISNVIPELRYAQSDLLTAMLGGLESFNSIGPVLTMFNGMNMQGGFQSSWIICSAIRLLNMQYMAEGSLAFDFSGQSVNLNIDRTQYIESALGRLDAMVENEVKPFKKLLGKAGITSGDGGTGNKSLQGNFGITTLSRAPTTRIYGGGIQSNFRRYW